jgi:hypothetical protein
MNQGDWRSRAPTSIHKSNRSPIPKVGVHLGVCDGSFLHTFLHSWEHEMWLLGFPLGSQPYKPLFWSRAQG